MKKIILILILFAVSQAGFSQASFKVSVSSDSLLFGNLIEVIFELKNADPKEMDLPEFPECEIVGGPNQSSSFSMINGVVDKSQSISYILKPKQEGSFFIAPASVSTEEGVLESLPVEILVFPNPEGIKQPLPRQKEYLDFDIFGPSKQKDQKKKKKRKTYRI